MTYRALSLSLPLPPSLSLHPQVYSSSNPLDQKDFNPIDYINELFPSEQVCHKNDQVVSDNQDREGKWRERREREIER